MLKSDCSGNLRSFALAVLTLLGGVLLSACGSSQAGNDAIALDQADNSAGRFTLSLLDGSIQDGGEYSLGVSDDGVQTTVSIQATGARNAKALYFEVGYDASQYSPVSAAQGSLFIPEGSIELAVLNEPGKVIHGQVLRNWDRRDGAFGDAVVATVRFEHRPMDNLRSSSSVPMSDTAKAPLQVFAGETFGSEALSAIIHYTNPGDYDQNGLVAIADLTPLGLHFGETVPSESFNGIFGLSGYPVEAVIDGDGNGQINIGDITPIGANFGNDVLGGYNLYASVTTGDIPASNTDPSTIVPTGSSAAASIFVSGDTAEDRLIYRYMQPTVPPGELYLWARPVSSTGEEGAISNVFRLVASPAPYLDLISSPTAGSGTHEDPYEVAATTDHEVLLTHTLDGDVTSSPDTFYLMYGLRDFITRIRDSELVEIREVSFAAPGLGELDEATGMLDIVDAYEGAFLIQALYGGRMSNQLNLLVPDPDNIGPVAVITATTTSGTAPWTVELSGTDSTDTDGEIASYEWDIDNDGSYEEVNPGPLFSFDIEDGGQLQVGLRVTDDDGATSTTSVTLNTTGWQTQVLDEVSDTLPADPMVQTIDGNPAVAYRQHNTLKYIRAADSMGASWNPPQAVPLSVAAQHICLREVEGRPAMAYQRSLSEPGIYYVLGDSADATSFEQVRITSSDMDHSPTLSVINGNPALAYAWHTGAAKPYTLLYVRASDTLGNTGGAWDLITAGYVIDSETLRIDKTSLQVTDTTFPGGRPCLMFIADNDEFGLDWNMYFTKATNASSSAWSLPVEISNNGDFEISYPAATSIVSRPRITYFNPSSQTLEYNYTPNLDGFNWGGAIVLPVGAATGRGYHPSVANVGGFAGVAYYDADEQCIRYVSTDDPEGDSGWSGNGYVAAAGAYDTGGAYNTYISLGAVAGKPAIAYHDIASAKLKFATFYSAP